MSERLNERRKEIRLWFSKTKELKDIEVFSLTDGEIELKSPDGGIICLYFNHSMNMDIPFVIRNSPTH